MPPPPPSPPPIVEQVVEFYSALFARLFSARFRPSIADPYKRRDVTRRIEEAADAASQSLARLLRNQQLSDAAAAGLLGGLARAGEVLDLDLISNPNVSSESAAEYVLERLQPPVGVDAPLFRISLHSLVQGLMLVAPVMVEWRKLGFAGTYELPRRVVQRLTQINEQVDALGRAGREAVDERYEWSYRDYLLQRFHRVEAGTVGIATSLDVELAELFIMPRLRRRLDLAAGPGHPSDEPGDLMGLRAARWMLARRLDAEPATEESVFAALDEVRRSPRLVVIGPPGSGKSTLLEWLRLKVAAAEEPLIAGDQQAIPLLLQVRQLDPRDLPGGSALIERATGSRDRASLMPEGWLERQMRKGRVLLLLDGLDEMEPKRRDSLLLPWVRGLCKQYPGNRYLVSSRPAGYPPSSLQELGFTECDLVDFSDLDVEEYTRHWCTAVRLARNEPADDARREGAAEAVRMVSAIQGHPYVRDLARNPLLLSAICMVQSFEGGSLPEDRALLYRACVEGLLHHWDQRRGIRSKYRLEEKLRACREVALAMQAEERAELPAVRVQEVFARALGDSERAHDLLDHVRYRTGLLLERRPGIFAFAHLTFQEYLAACAVREGNLLGIGADVLAGEFQGGRWREVIVLYCRLAPAPAARELIRRLVAQEPSEAWAEHLASLLAEAYLSAGPEMARDVDLRREILDKIAASTVIVQRLLDRFPQREAAEAAHRTVGRGRLEAPTQAFCWLREHPEQVDFAALEVGERLRKWWQLAPHSLTELVYLAHRHGPGELLCALAREPYLYESPGALRGCMADWAFVALNERQRLGSPGIDEALLAALQVIAQRGFALPFNLSFPDLRFDSLPRDVTTWPTVVALARATAERTSYSSDAGMFSRWATLVERRYRKRTGQRMPSPAPAAGHLPMRDRT
jgi:hypothetical protein